MNELQDTQDQRENIYIGIDVHKKSWSVSIMSDHLELKSFSQPPEPKVLSNYLHKHFPGARYQSAYESGFSGFWAHRALVSLGVENIVVNPSDIPSTDKEKKRKRDTVDCRKIARSLRSKELRGIHVPDEVIDQDKALVRSRGKLVADIKRCKNRIKSLFHYWGIQIPEEMDSPYWSKTFRKWIRELDFNNASASLCVIAQLEGLEQIEAQKKRVEKELIHLSATRYQKLCDWLRSIPGIGLLGAMTLITEIKDIHRFSKLDRLHSFVGLVPNVSSSSERETIRGITQRHNHYLRPLLVQCAWRAAKVDPELFRDYNRLCRKMKANKAIIRIAKKLLNRVGYVWKNECVYEMKD
ncbi:MAG: IS110 family transposase [Bacteroidota bacterium]